MQIRSMVALSILLVSFTLIGLHAADSSEYYIRVPIDPEIMRGVITYESTPSFSGLNNTLAEAGSTLGVDFTISYDGERNLDVTCESSNAAVIQSASCGVTHTGGQDYHLAADVESDATGTATLTLTASGWNAMPNAATEVSGSFDVDIPTPEIFTATGTDQTFTVPSNVTYIKLQVWGAGGGRSSGGGGGYADGFLRVTPGEELTVQVGGKGSSGTGGWPYGGDGGTGKYQGNGGGGLSGVLDGANYLIIAGGGGGGGTYQSNYAAGGGGLVGADGAYASFSGYGGTQFAAGARGGTAAGAGSGHQGGVGGLSYNDDKSGSGGGGGWYGGGGGWICRG